MSRAHFMRIYHIRAATIIFLIVLSVSASSVQAQPPEKTLINFNWSEDTYSVSFEREWNGVPMILNYTGSYNDEYTYHNNYFNESGDTWIKEIVTVNHLANYSHFSNSTRVGYIKMNLTLEVFRVDITIGAVGRVIWMALKMGSLELEHYLKGEGYSINYFEEYQQIINTKYLKYNTTTWELIDTWTKVDNVLGEQNYSNAWPYEESPAHILKTTEFSTPLILCMQMYRTEKGDKIAWANVFHDFIFYEDEDNDGIFSVGDKTEAPSSTPNLYTSDEFRGWMVPLVEDTYFRGEEEFGNYSWTNHYPKDRTVKEIASTIQFTPPTTTTGSDINWGIQYPNFPIDTTTIDHNKPIEEWYWTPPNASFIHTSPSTFSYSFDYFVNTTQADLDFTLEMPKLTNDSFYNAVQGYSLALPHYNYFLSSFDIEEENPKELTAPAKRFTFKSNKTVVAEINMIKPGKENYTIYDYPSVSENTNLEAKGGSINALMMGAAELSANSGNIFANLIYGIRDVVQTDPSFIVTEDLYRLETQNYPVWNGEKFTHDPTLTIYYTDYTQLPLSINGPELIPGFNIAIVIGLAVVISLVGLKRKKIKSKSIFF